ncbi:hypothetical protein DSM100238_0758 [Bifidobacterium apri]|uniref:Uncharacterized protein n=1 Tax=Bifidobacterium apri TaxID=1769423 RepID=A0A6A2W449_9BIFI|nr:hypothetical protein DSM100238_0758 [Bifidobacterium apri]
MRVAHPTHPNAGAGVSCPAKSNNDARTRNHSQVRALSAYRLHARNGK